MSDSPPGRRPPGDRYFEVPSILPLSMAPSILPVSIGATVHLAFVHGAVHLAGLHRATVHLAFVHGAVHLAGRHGATVHLACGPFVRGTAGQGTGGPKQRGGEGRESKVPTHQ